VSESLLNLDGTPAVGVTGTARLASVPTDLFVALWGGATLSSTSNSSGDIEWTLPRGAVVLFNIPGFITNKRGTIPANASARLADLI
jgi:hypothetical protein